MTLQTRFSLVISIVIIASTHGADSINNVQVIVINSNYNNSSVNTVNNIESILHGLGKETGSGGMSSTGATTARVYDQQRTSTTTIRPSFPNPTVLSTTVTPRQFTTYFGTTFSPYVRNDGFRKNGYTNEHIQEMLMVIQSKCHSILTFEMGYYATPFFFGPYDATSPSKIATAAAQINAQRNASLLTVSQGAYIITSSIATPRFPDLDAAFYSAQKANAIYPGTVYSITLFIQDPSALASIGLTLNTAYTAAVLLQQYSSQAHAQNLRMGVAVTFCDQILDANDANLGKQLLFGLASVSDYIICEIYPSGSDESNFESVRQSFESIKLAFSRVAPAVEIVLFTGSYPNEYLFSGSSAIQQNSPMKIKRFWDAVERWSLESRQKVYMYQAFDTFEKPEVGYGGSRDILNGYWKRTGSGSYMVKATQQLVSA